MSLNENSYEILFAYLLDASLVAKNLCYNNLGIELLNSAIENVIKWQKEIKDVEESML